MIHTKRIFCVALALCLLIPDIVVLSEAPVSDGYTVHIITPENQIGGDTGYYDLLVTPGQKQELTGTILNRADTEIEVLVQSNTAYTNENGLVQFDELNDTNDESMTVDFASIATLVEPIGYDQPIKDDGSREFDGVVYRIPAEGSTAFTLLVEVPDESFDGAVLGGLMFTKLNQGDSDVESTFGIRNIYRYVKAVRLRENLEDVDPVFEMQSASASVDQVSRPLLHLGLRNPVPLLAHEITLRGSVYLASGGGAIFTFERNNISMAPSSTMLYNVKFDSKELPPSGEYKVSLELQYGDRTWQFEQPLIIP